MKQNSRRKVTPEMIKRMEKLSEGGLSHKEIADKFKLSKTTVYNYLKKEEKVGLVERLKRKLGRESKKEKALVYELSLRERRNLAIFAIVIVISTILSGTFGPQFGALAEQGKWLGFISLGVILILCVFLLLEIAVTIMKRHWKR